MKNTFKSTSGTSFHGTTIKTSVECLKAIVGNPISEGNDGRDKSNFDWQCETENGKLITIYDWKEYRPISESELIDFHIGGFKKSDTDEAKIELEILLNA